MDSMVMSVVNTEEMRVASDGDRLQISAAQVDVLVS